MSAVTLREFDNSWYHPGRNPAWRAAWFFLGAPLLSSVLFSSSRFRAALLRFFGAAIGQRVVIRHHVKVKYPWRLTIGDDAWIGEACWIDNLVSVQVGSNACLSQACYLCTGNHDWTDPHFGLIVAPIEIGPGAWVGAKALLTPGVQLGEGAVAASGSVVTKHIPPYEIHAGNPAVFAKRRLLKPPDQRPLRACDHENSSAESVLLA
jgi:putative colanic acid biosynthesis acetyltransferase WcaF